MYGVIFEILIGFLYANFLDWYLHILLHKPRGQSSFKFHWTHHKITRKNRNLDPEYSAKIFHNETWLGILGVILHIPLLWLSFPFALTSILYIMIYLIIHKEMHTRVDFFKKWMPWHYEHHMGKNQNKNWCVVFPLMDHIAGTRDPWLKKQNKSYKN